VIDFEKELEAILRDDPLGLLKSMAKASTRLSVDERLLASFNEIVEFVRGRGREPEASKDIGERRLHSRLKGLRENPEKAAALKEIDELGLLAGVEVPVPPEINDIDDILGRDDLGLLDEGPSSDDPGTILRLKNVKRPSTPPDFLAKRKPCDEFDQFEPIFKRYHAGLASGAFQTMEFSSERQIEKERVFLLQGMLVYVAGVADWEKKNFGNADRRLLCIFENGTESNMLQRSLAAALWKAEGSAEVVERSQLDLRPGGVSGDDTETGYVYVLRTLSPKPELKAIEHLYKIGFSAGPVPERIANAEKEPTYLMARVHLVTMFQVFNVSPQKLEYLVHRFFGAVRLDLTVTDSDGQLHTPREWFVVPLPTIEAAVHLLISGEITKYRYDPKQQEIVAGGTP